MYNINENSENNSLIIISSRHRLWMALRIISQNGTGKSLAVN